MKDLYELQKYVSQAYGTTVAFTPDGGNVTVEVAELTGNMTFNITKRDIAEPGDILKLNFLADGTERVVTLGGTNGKAGTVTVPLSTAVSVYLIYSAVSDQYQSVFIPT